MEVRSTLLILVLAIGSDVAICGPVNNTETLQSFIDDIAPEPSPQVQCLIDRVCPGKKLPQLSRSEIGTILETAASEIGNMTASLNNLRGPVLIRCVIDWFDEHYGQGFTLSAADQKICSKKIPALQKVFLRQKRWMHILTTCTSAPEVTLIKERVANESITIDKFSYGVGNLYEVIANTVIHGLTQGTQITPVAILEKDLFKKCGNVLMSIAPSLLALPESSEEESTTAS